MAEDINVESNLEAPRLERRLVAILAADIEGYSRHMEQDEIAALATLSSVRLVVDALIASHKGRITGTAGDSVLAEFVSLVDALDCAVKIQQDVATAGESQPPEHRMQFRIGVNVGDVMVKDDDIFGDGVNIAARLETLALPGGICVSRGVRDHVQKMGQYSFEDLGEQSVKNIAQPIRAFRLRSAITGATDPAVDSGPALPATSPPAASAPAPFELPFWDAIKESKDPAEYAAYLERYPKGAFSALAEARATALLAEQSVPVPVPADPDIVTVELAFWDAIKASEDPAEFAAYLERYPEGSFATLAGARRQTLLEAKTEPASAATASVELTFWDTVKKSDNPAMYTAYLEQYPAGSFAALALVRLAELAPPT
ncbi:MAG: adenylate/guanylate cyclase domain-containing protein [Reyranellales bacterium]